MSCPTCDHTMVMILTRVAFHCPRCGTVVGTLAGASVVLVPKLVERCRKFEEELQQGTPNVNDWIVFGIAESINKPEQRPA